MKKAILISSLCSFIAFYSCRKEEYLDQTEYTVYDVSGANDSLIQSVQVSNGIVIFNEAEFDLLMQETNCTGLTYPNLSPDQVLVLKSGTKLQDEELAYDILKVSFSNKKENTIYQFLIYLSLPLSNQDPVENYIFGVVLDIESNSEIGFQFEPK